jgi:hypothetical protein
MPKSTVPLPDWEFVLSSAARLQRILPDAVLVGGTASAIHAEHRFSRDADPVLTDLRHRFDEVLADIEFFGYQEVPLSCLESGFSWSLKTGVSLFPSDRLRRLPCA